MIRFNGIIVAAATAVAVIIASFVGELYVKEFHSFVRAGKKKPHIYVIQANKTYLSCFTQTFAWFIPNTLFLWQRQKDAQQFECGGSIPFIFGAIYINAVNISVVIPFFAHVSIILFTNFFLFSINRSLVAVVILWSNKFSKPPWIRQTELITAWVNSVENRSQNEHTETHKRVREEERSGMLRIIKPKKTNTVAIIFAHYFLGFISRLLLPFIIIRLRLKILWLQEQVLRARSRTHALIVER